MISLPSSMFNISKFQLLQNKVTEYTFQRNGNTTNDRLLVVYRQLIEVIFLSVLGFLSID